MYVLKRVMRDQNSNSNKHSENPATKDIAIAQDSARGGRRWSGLTITRQTPTITPHVPTMYYYFSASVLLAPS